ncbi:hypothetical protein [Pseudomonas sp. FME51]|uniref:hypothetical protein n=1 Tax=Pseudomonas sp. FME51 TaxID=2742609 RepID=UPI001865F59D|nr:hypothetical protein [Pseudomonas sp. FME51]
MLGMYILGFLSSIFIITFATYMKVFGFITEPSFVVFVLAGLVIGLFIAFSDRVESVSLKGKLVLSKIEKKHEDILNIESSIKEISRSTMELVEVVKAGSWAVSKEEDDSFDNAKQRLNKYL